MLDFKINNFLDSFNSKDINGFNIMIMQSQQDADNLIKQLKQKIDLLENIDIDLEYDDNNLLEEDKERVKKEIQNYINQRFE